ncbi:MAG: hypothetical protein HEP71_28055 [Roseivirga sp.]|nr:hypothetical protein [Roseivirga sp.]
MPVNKKSEVRYEVSIIEMAKLLWKGKLWVIKVSSIFVVLGLAIALTTPKEWQTSTKLFMDYKSGGPNLGALSSLVGLAGVRLPQLQSGGSLTPMAYEEVLKDNELILDILDDKFYFSTVGDSLTLRDFYLEETRKSPVSSVLGSYKYILKLFKKKPSDEGGSSKSMGGSFLNISLEDEGLIDRFKESLKVSVDVETFMLSISIKLQDPQGSAQVSLRCYDKLKAFLDKYTKEKNLKNLEFVETQLEAKRKEFLSAQKALADFLDSNQALSTRAAESEVEVLRNRKDLIYSVYLTLSNSYQEAVLAAQSSSSFLAKVGPTRVPVVPSEPQKLNILITWTLLGGIIASIIYLVKNRDREPAIVENSQ